MKEWKLIDLAKNGGEPAVRLPKPHYTWPILGEEELRAVTSLIQTGTISIYGREGVVAEFEDAFAAFYGMKYALSTNSGTCALFAAYFGVGLGPGDEVIAPVYTFPATVTPILHCNAIPILCDCDPVSGNVTVDRIGELITERTKAVVVTHMWGLPAPIDQIAELCRKHKLHLIEDCSHAHAATLNGRFVGTYGSVACFSLQANKMVAAGEGGILLTNSDEIYQRATLLGNFRHRAKQTVTLSHLSPYCETGFGLKLKIHPLAAAIALIQLRKSRSFITMREERLRRLSSHLEKAAGITPPVYPSECTRGAWYGYKPHYDRSQLNGLLYEEYLDALVAEGLDVHRPGTRPLHLTPLFSSLNGELYKYGCPVRCPHVSNVSNRNSRLFLGAEEFYSTALSVPPFTTEPFELVDAYGLAFQKVGSAYAG